MATTTITPIDALKLALKDRSNSFLTDDEYERFLLAHVTPAQTYTAVKLTAGYWLVPTCPLCLFGASFSEQPGASYTLASGGGGLYGAVSIKLTAGTDARDSIAVSGCPLDFNCALEELLVFIATHRAQEYSQSVAGSSLSPQTAREELLRQAEVLRGVRAV